MTVALRMISSALTRGLLQGTLTYAGAAYPCNHSPIADTPVLSNDGGGFTPQRLVTLVIKIADAPAGTFAVNRLASLVAADGRTYALRLTANEAAGNPYFHQFTARHESEGA